MSRAVSLIVVAVAGLVAAGGLSCKQGEQAGGGKPRVVATTTMIGDLVRRIGGDRVEVRVTMGPGVDPHTHKPSPSEIADMRSAAVVFYNGHHLEGKMTERFEEPEMEGRALAVTSAIPEGRLLPWQEGETGTFDPHVWFNAELWALAAGAVRDKLIEVDPEGESEYRRRAEEVIASLRALHEEVKGKLASVPRERRVLITSHDAYNYFGQAYDVTVLGLQGISTEGEADSHDIRAAADMIVEKRIPAIFVETSVSKQTIRRVLDDCRARGVEVKEGGELYSDAMGRPGERPGYAVETYEGMMRYNVDTIVAALK